MNAEIEAALMRAGAQINGLQNRIEELQAANNELEYSIRQQGSAWKHRAEKAEARVTELEALFGEVFNDHNEPDGAPDGGYKACDCRFCSALEKLLQTRN